MGSGLFYLFCNSWLMERAGLFGCQRLDKSKTSFAAAIAELHRAADLGKQGIVLADANIRTRLDRCPTLTNDDCAAGYNLAAKGLDAQPLGI